ncbi:hypothetical protein CE91St24_10090 [Odoribacteraceae bacterium]|jgi:hypothetical protein|nr:hypothetical protein CE91St21_34180 [Odoribacteraceae bacterium]GGJ59051.1 hypothetical protein GCM10007042_17700 [Butyricimonas paravirosa]GKH94848.1 hypothetical protein CE91St23_33440 [Odoribacteraceae bacterium]GKH97471.1 hypothetical protein CE91St22_13490 [Odoribacteraceae bacterium]GKI01734.1 hypothetical protein CE91St24_10090 [Odoribacteraceae bacterium]
MEYLHYSTFSTSVTGIVLLKIQMYEKKANCTSSPEKKVIKNMVDYEVYRPVYVRVRNAADGCGVQPRSKSDVVCERRFF